MPIPRAPAQLAFALCMITFAVNLQAPLYNVYAELSGKGTTATAVAFSAYVVGVIPVLLLLGGLADRLGRRPIMLIALGVSMLATALMLLAPGLETLGLARLMLGIGTALASATGAAYMSELMQHPDTSRATTWVTASTSLGFGLGAAMTSLCLLRAPTLAPESFYLQLVLAGLALLLVWRLPDQRQHSRSTWLRLPCYPSGSLPYGMAILLAWACVGLVGALLPAILKEHGLSRWSGFATFCVISCGVLFQPLARRITPAKAALLGLAILPVSYAILAWGADNGQLLAVLIGTIAASSACYGFIYLGGLSAVTHLAGEQKSRASAGFFLLAYIGFSLPVILTGLLVEQFGTSTSLLVFGLALLAGCLMTGAALLRSNRAASLTALASLK